MSFMRKRQRKGSKSLRDFSANVWRRGKIFAPKISALRGSWGEIYADVHDSLEESQEFLRQTKFLSVSVGELQRA